MTRSEFPLIIATLLLQTNSFGYDFKNLTKWASQTWNPAYVDNRRLLSQPLTRGLLSFGLAQLLQPSHKSSATHVYGIPTAGIGPATLLALKLGKPLLLTHEGKFYSIDLPKYKEYMEEKRSDTYVGTFPFGIPLALVAAEVHGANFLFARSKAKDHGKNKQIEGIIIPGTAQLCHPASNDTLYNLDQVKEVLTECGINVLSVENKDISFYSDVISEVPETEFKNIIAIAVEDLVSTGGSSIKEIQSLEEAGMKVIAFVSVFNYLLQESKDLFKQEGHQCYHLTSFDNVLAVGKASGVIPSQDCTELTEWHKNQRTYAIDRNLVPTEEVA